MSKHSIDLGALGRTVENFSGTLHRPEGDLSGVWARIECEGYEPSGIKVTLLHQEFARMFGLRGFLSHMERDLRMTCVAPFVFPIWFWGITGMKQSGDKLELDVSGYDLGTNKDPMPAGEDVTLFAYLTRGRLHGRGRSPVHRWDGTITYSIEPDKVEDEKEEVIEWQEGARTTRLIMQHEYEDAKVGDNKILLQLARPAMVRTFKADGGQSLCSIVEETTTDLSEICLMLSLALREKIQWYEIKVETYKSRVVPRLIPRAKRRSAIAERNSSGREEPLIDYDSMAPGGFKELLDLFRKCEHRKTLERAIAFEIGSRRVGGGLEASYVLCYAALEAIASGAVSHGVSLPRYRPAEWKKLVRSLEREIDAVGNQLGLVHELIESTKNRIHLLGRPSLAELLLQLTETLGVKVNDLWPDDVGLERGLRHAFKIRNSLVHRAVIHDELAMWENLVRLRALTERLILKLIGWPNEKVWVRADELLQRVNKDS